MKSRKIWFFCIILIITDIFIVEGCKEISPQPQRQSALERITQAKTINVGYIVFPPAITKDPNSGALGGHFVQTINEICRQVGWQPNFIESDWKGFAAGLKSKRFDLSIAPTFITIPRALAVNFTRPLFYSGNSAVVRKQENRFSDIMSLDRDGVTISATQGAAAHEFAKSNFKHAQLRILPGPDQSLTLQDVISRRSDAALADAYETSKFAAAHPKDVKDLLADNPYNLTPVSWAVSNDEQELLNFVNFALEAMETQGKLQEFEDAAGAHWLHISRSFVLNPRSNK